MKQKHPFLFPLLMALVMMAMSPTTMWANDTQSSVSTQVTITATSNDSRLGTVTGGGTYDYSATEMVTLEAIPSECCDFVKWSDGETAWTRQVPRTGDLTLTAEFKQVEPYYNEIWYTTTDGNAITTSVLTEMGPTSNTYDAANSRYVMTFSQDLTSIEPGAFKDCSTLQTVTIPSSVQVIGDLAFSGCVILTAINIPYGVQTIGSSAFEYCGNARSITIPNSVKTIGSNAFKGCYVVNYGLNNNSSITLEERGLTVCATEQEDGLMTKGTSVVFCRKWATSVAIPSNVTSIGASAFSGCSSLTTIVVGDGWSMENVTYSEGVFTGCTSLKGQNGTAYSAEHVDGTYAHVDGDYGQPGYLSRAGGKVKIAESLASGASVSFDVTPDVDAIYTFTTSDANATIVIREKGAIAKPADTGSLTYELAAGDTYTVTIENNTEAAMTDLTVSISKQVINYITLTVGETTSVGDIAADTYPYCHFTPATSGYYTFTASNESVEIIIVSGSVYNPNTISQYWGSCDAVLQAGTTYLVVPGNFTDEAMSDVTVTTTKVDFPALTMGENSDITIPACPYGFTTVATFTPAKTDTYQFTIDPSEVFIFVNTGAQDIGSYTPGEYEVELEAGKMYAVMAYSQTATTGTITISRDVPTINADTWKEVLAEINSARVEYNDTYTITFADSYSGSDEGTSVGTGVKLYGGEDTGYHYVVAPTTPGDVIMAPADCSELFAGLTNLTSITFDNFNTSKVSKMYGMFSGCTNLTALTIGNFDMSQVTPTTNMFDQCISLSTLTMKSLPYLVDGTFNTQFSGEGKTVSVELDDNSVMYTGDKTNYLPEATSATYTRTMPTDAETGKARRWGTAVLPFYFYPDDQTDVEPYEVSDLAKNGAEWTMSVERYDRGSVTPGEPFLFYNTSGAATVTFTGDANQKGYVYIYTKIEPRYIVFGEGANEGSGDYTYISWKGTYEETKIQSKSNYSLYFVAQDKFWLAEAETTVKPFRGWFELGSGYNEGESGDGGGDGGDGGGDGDPTVKSFTIVIDDETDGINETVHDTSYMVNGTSAKRLENRRIVILKNGKKYNTAGQVIR